MEVRIQKRDGGLVDIIVKRTLRDENPTQVAYGVGPKDVEPVMAKLIAEVAGPEPG